MHLKENITMRGSVREFQNLFVQQSKMLKIYSEVAIFVLGSKILSTILLVEILTSQEDKLPFIGEVDFFLLCTE